MLLIIKLINHNYQRCPNVFNSPPNLLVPFTECMFQISTSGTVNVRTGQVLSSIPPTTGTKPLLRFGKLVKLASDNGPSPEKSVEKTSSLAGKQTVRARTDSSS